MTSNIPTPVCAFGVSAHGDVTPLDVAVYQSRDQDTYAYIWLHFDMNDVHLEPWLTDRMSAAALRALLQQETRPRCDALENGMILTLRGVNLNPGADPDDMVSIRLWAEGNVIVSARMRRVLAVDAVRQKMETGRAPASMDAFIAEIAYGLTKRIEKVSLELVETTDALEEDVLDATKSVTSELATARQAVIKLRRFVRPQTEALGEFSHGEVLPLGAQTQTLLKETVNRATRTMEELDATADRLQAIQDQLDNLNAATLGRNSYVLSVVAAIFLPLGFLTGLMGINVGGMPMVDAPYGFWLVSIGSVVLGFGLFWLFRLLKWL